MEVTFLPSINDCPAEDWNRICNTSYPFIQHQFLAALENSNSVGEQAGWLPQHITVHEGDNLVAIMPLYKKTHSYGEYVFDWSWADAYHRNNIEYYPKLLSAIPFTPATGPRLCVQGVDEITVLTTVKAAIQKRCQLQRLSGWHVLFTEGDKSETFTHTKLMRRIGSQYHWFNQGFTSFDDFLATFASRKRKNLRKERNKVFTTGITFKTLTGDELTPEVWQRFYNFYQITYAKRSGHGGYLTEAFFNELSQTMRNNIVLVLAYEDDEAIAGALNFKSNNTLYGRYWGAIKEVDGLHFETCYYQGIEYCIANGLQKFDPGAQGEHKIQRGFTPIVTESWHYLAHPGFSNAIADFLEQETPHIEEYITDAKSYLPFKNNDN